MHNVADLEVREVDGAELRSDVLRIARPEIELAVLDDGSTSARSHGGFDAVLP